jgi:methylmalonyl-CoA mutase cobalamin-binding subunit
MRRMIVCLGVAGLVVFAALSLAPVPVQAAADKVTICHFAGHENSSVKGARDYATKEGDSFCEKLGGNVISISEHAREAHGISKCDPKVEKCEAEEEIPKDESK